MHCLFILVPLVTLIVLNLPLRALMRRCAFWAVSALLLGQMGLVLFPVNLAVPCTFPLAADAISNVVLMSIGIVLFATLLVGRAIMKNGEKLFNFANLLLIVQMGTNGVALVTDIFSLYVFIEIAAVASYILISIDKEKLALEAAFKYIILSALASALMLTAIALLLVFSGSTSFSAIQAAMKTMPASLYVSFSVGIFVCALFIKGGLMPFHGWLPDAYSAAPASVSVLLAGIATKVLGVYALIRLMVSVIGFNPPVQQVLLCVGALSIVAGALAALGQQDFKRMLAYSSISQVGYIIIGLGCGTPLGIFGAVFHLFNHSIFKSSLFLNSAAVEAQAGTRDMDRMGGLGAKMPVTGITSVIASLSAAGIPPLAGFWSKLIIIIALWTAGYYPYAVIGVVAGTVTLAYFLSMQRRVFFGPREAVFDKVQEAPFGLLLPVLILTVITVGLGLVFPFLPGIASLYK